MIPLPPYGGLTDVLFGATLTFRYELTEGNARCDVIRRFNPYAEPPRTLTALGHTAIFYVIDDLPPDGGETAACFDLRDDPTIQSLDALRQIAINHLSFQKPIGIMLPLAAMDPDVEVRRRALRPVVAGLCAKLRVRASIGDVPIPSGHENVARLLPAFLADHPEWRSNVFLMMRFRDGPQYAEIDRAIRTALAPNGLKVIRADDRAYSDDLWENVRLYMIGCSYGVVVFEEIDEREFNPNVSLEMGFMLALNKRCLILKDKRMPTVPTDVVGKLYREFDGYRITDTVTEAAKAWVKDVGRA